MADEKQNSLFILPNLEEDKFRDEESRRVISQKAGAALAVSPDREEEMLGDIVNVVSDFRWTLSPKESRFDVPYISMIERKITNDVLIQQVVYNLLAAVDTTVDVRDTTRRDIIERYLDSGRTSEDSFTAGEVVDAINETLNRVSAQKLGESPYAGLYGLEDTGWHFIFPYFDTQNHSVANAWGTPSGGLVEKLAVNLSEGIGTGASIINRIQSVLGAAENGDIRVGTYIEKAKQFTFPTSGPKYNLAFHLYNTYKTEDIIKNWELCFLLIYNNLPNRRTRTIFEPPPLYEILIPGVRRSPVSFISSLRVDFVGATRMMKLDVIGNEIETLVPEAYKITIGVEDVLPESKNFLQSMVDDTIRVHVGAAAMGGDIRDDGSLTEGDPDDPNDPNNRGTRDISDSLDVGAEHNRITHIKIDVGEEKQGGRKNRFQRGLERLGF